MKILMFTDSVTHKSFALDYKASDIEAGVYTIDTAKKWLTKKSDQAALIKTINKFNSAYSGVGIVFEHEDEKEVMRLALTKKMALKLKKNDTVSILNNDQYINNTLDIRIQELLKNITIQYNQRGERILD
jgi:hypothetical protein